MPNRVPAEVFAPGELIREELEARGWTQVDLAEILGRPVRLVNELVAGKKQITPDTAKGLAEAFQGTDPVFWMNLDSAYRLSKAKPVNASVRRRSKLYSLFPVREMIKRALDRGLRQPRRPRIPRPFLLRDRVSRRDAGVLARRQGHPVRRKDGPTVGLAVAGKAPCPGCARGDLLRTETQRCRHEVALPSGGS